MGTGAPVERYYIYNVIYTFKDFTRDLHGKGQVIRHSAVVGYHHNGVAENAIKNVVRIPITMMIHSTLRWLDAS